jgi:DNA-binding NarL/FixJ family response regulator
MPFEASMKLPRVILADDHKLVAEALQNLMAPHFEVVDTVCNGHQLLESAISRKPDLVVIDVGMPLLNGLEAGRELKIKMPAIKLVFLTMNEDPELALQAMKAGASCYVLKNSAGSELLEAMRMAIQGKTYISPQIARGMQESFIRNPLGNRPKSITPRQRQVVQLLAEGKSMKEAAQILKISPRTIAFHKYHLMQDLGLKTNAEVLQFAIKNRIVV